MKNDAITEEAGSTAEVSIYLLGKERTGVFFANLSAFCLCDTVPHRNRCVSKSGF